MRTTAGLFLAACLSLSGTSRAAAPAVSPAYDAKAAPLDELSKDLLSDSGYEVRDDGRVWDKINETAVSRDDMPYVLSRLASARRLKALLELNNIITRYDAERKLTPEDKEAVRAIARKNWPVFGIAPRHDFRSYFSVEELETLDKIPLRFETMDPSTMKDPEPVSVTADAPVPSITAAPPAAPAPVPVPVSTTSVSAPAAVVAAPEAVAKPVPTLAPMMDAPALPRPTFAAVPAAVPPAPPAAAVPVPAAPVANIFKAPAAAPAVAPAAAAPDLGTLKPWTPPAASTAAPAAVAPAPKTVAASSPTLPAPPQAPAAPPPAPEPPKPAVVTAADYEAFVAAGPYTKEGKELLQLIGKRAPDFCLPLLRRTVVVAVPQIVVDGARTGEGLRAGLILGADSITPPVVALSPGPLMIEVKKGIFGRHEKIVLFESPAAWRALGVAPPSLAAAKADAAPVSVENGDWGPVKVYADGSRRGAYSSAEQAGELLQQLLRLGLAREGLDASEYAARRWTRTARLMFSARLKDETRQDGFLDPDRRAELRGWLDRGDEEDDGAFAAWAGARTEALDPRRGPPDAERSFEAGARAACARAALEDALVAAARARARRVATLESLMDAGAVDDAAAKAAAQAAVAEEAAARARLLASPPACAAPDPRREEGLRKASLVLAEAVRAERALREAKAGGEHAL